MTTFTIPAWDQNDIGDSSCVNFSKYNNVKNGRKKKNRVNKTGGIVKAKGSVKTNFKKVKNNLLNSLNGGTEDLFRKIDEKLRKLAEENNDDTVKLLKDDSLNSKKKMKKKKINITPNKNKDTDKLIQSPDVSSNKFKKTLLRNKEKKLKKKEKQLLVEKEENEVKKPEIPTKKKKLKKHEMKMKALQHNKNANQVQNKKNKKAQKNKSVEDTELVQKLQHNEEVNSQPAKISKKAMKLKQRLKKALSENVNLKPTIKPEFRKMSLRERMMQKLKGARFRMLNEQIYTTESKDAKDMFEHDPEAFKAYHEGYRHQVSKWPMNPLDKIIEHIKKMPLNNIVADFGCGDAKLAASVKQKVHSFDLIAVNEKVTACDMAKVPLGNSSVDVVVFCLSLMGTNLRDYLLEANRVLKIGGILKIAEVESRFDKVESFIDGVQKFHFKNTWKDLSHNLFYFLDFKKESNVKQKFKMPLISLHPCLYKKR